MKKEVIGIIGGTGEMGVAFEKYFVQNGYRVHIAGRSTELSYQKLAEQSDIVIISVPISAFAQTVLEVAPHMKPNALLMDFCSVKAEPLKVMLGAFNGEVIGCHPMFGGRNLEPGQTVVFCKGRGEKWFGELPRIFTGFKRVEFAAAEHDKAMALVQGVQHFFENAFAATVIDSGLSVEKLLSVASPVYRIQMALVGRILGQNEKLYGEIVYGSKASRAAIDVFRQKVLELSSAERSEFEQQFLQGRSYFGNFAQSAQTETDRIISMMAANDHESTAVNTIHDSVDIVTLGPKFTWSHLAAEKYFADAKLGFAPNFAEVFSALKSGSARAVLLPLENKISGTVREVWQRIMSEEYAITKAVNLPIDHVLAAPVNDSIKVIYGHAEALAQCRRFLDAEYPTLKKVAVGSNSQALSEARQALGGAAICSEKAALANGFKIIAENIADSSGNTTRFGLIQKATTESQNNIDVTSLYFELQNKPGALLNILGIFARSNHNLVRIESVPKGGDFDEYGFFVELEGELRAEVFDVLKKELKKLQLLGAYAVVEE
jgi:prephenate dehydrogenase